MPSHSILPESRRVAIEAAFDEALAEVRAAGDVALLQECRAIFRKRVPLNLRAYVAATLALKGGALPSDRRGRAATEGRREAKGNGNARKDGRQPQGTVQGARQAPVTKKAEKQRREPEPRENKEPVESRENRYRGEGVTLFVSAGRRQRFYARVAIKILLDVPNVTEESVGDIRTMDNYSFIVVDPAVEEAVIAALSGYDFKGRTLAANRARKRGEPAPARDEDIEESIAEDDSDQPDLEPFGAAPVDEFASDDPEQPGDDGEASDDGETSDDPIERA